MTHCLICQNRILKSQETLDPAVLTDEAPETAVEYAAHIHALCYELDDTNHTDEQAPIVWFLLGAIKAGVSFNGYTAREALEAYCAAVDGDSAAVLEMLEVKI